MIGPGKQRCGPGAVADHGDRDHNLSPSAGIMAIGHREMAMLHAICVKGNAGAYRRGIHILLLYEQFTGYIRQALIAGLCDADAFGDLKAPILHPQPGHEMEGHIFLQHGFVPWA